MQQQQRVVPQCSDHELVDNLIDDDACTQVHLRSEGCGQPAAGASSDDDLLGLTTAAGSNAGTSRPALGTSHIDDLFAVPARKPSPRGSSTANSEGSATTGGGASFAATPARGLGSMIELGASLSAVDAACFSELYQDAEVTVRVPLSHVLHPGCPVLTSPLCCCQRGAGCCQRVCGAARSAASAHPAKA